MTRLHVIRQACQIAPEMRTEEHIGDILEVVKDVPFFFELTEFQQRGLCQTMTLEVFGPREVVIEMGTVGDKFYIILSGGVSVQAPDTEAPCPNGVHTIEACTCPNRPMTTVSFLERGISFGEFALQSDQPRSASIITNERTELLVTKHADYDRFAGQHHGHFIEQRVKFLRQCPRIEEALRNQLVTPQDIWAMANCLNEAHLRGNALACRQGALADRMLFVRSGRLVVIKAVDVDEATGRRPAPASAEAKGAEKQPAGANTDMTEEEAANSPSLAKAMLTIKKKERQARLQKLTLSQEGFSEGDPLEAHTIHAGFGSSSASTGPAAGEAADSAGGGRSASAEGRRASGGSEAPAGKSRTSIQPDKRGPEGRKSLDQPRGAQTSRERPTSVQPRRGKDGRVETGSAPSAPPRRRRLLRIGTIGPYQYYGDQQLCTSEVYPVSIISDPVAEIYVMSKHDILRRLPKKMLSALFTQEKEVVPSDEQLLQMHRQTQRWNAFRRGMHAEALANRSQGPSYGLRSSGAASHINVAENLEFLGISATDALAKTVLPLPTTKRAALTHREQEHFSDASAWFLRKVKAIKNDPGLRNALAKAGLSRQRQLGDCLADDDGSDDKDPMSFRLKEYWSKLVVDPVGQDIDAALSAEEALKPTSASSRMFDIPTPRSTRRQSMQTGPGLSEGAGGAATAGIAGLKLPPVRAPAGKPG